MKYNAFKIFLVFFTLFCLLIVFKQQQCKHNEINELEYNDKNMFDKSLINENFFVFDSNNLKKVKSHMYGYSISKNGILTDNYYKQIGKYEIPDPSGVYVMIRRKRKEIILNQDFQGNFGLYLYENIKTKYFALSNSFLMLEEYLIDKQNISLNKDFSNNLVISGLCSPSIYETMIKEINKIPSNTFIIINIKNKSFKFNYINYEEQSVPLESKEGLKIIDQWVDKWGFIIRSLIKKTNNTSLDLSGGFDTRTLLSIFLSSGIEMKNLLIYSIKNNNQNHEEDFKIASKIADAYNFKLNNFNLDNKSIKWGIINTLFCTLYSKLGFHKEFYFQNRFFNKPRFLFHGGGEIRGYPRIPIEKYIEGISSENKYLGEEFYSSSKRLCNRSVSFLKKEKEYNNSYEISSSFYQKGRSANHDGKAALEGFIANIYLIQPLIDPDIKKIKFIYNYHSTHDLISYVYIRFAKNLVNFQFQGNRTLISKSIIKAKILNNLIKPYEIKLDYNEKFFIDDIRKCPVPVSNENKKIDTYLKKLFDSSIFIQTITKLYEYKIYKFAKEYSNHINYYPFRHFYGLLSVAITIDNLSLNELLMNKLTNKSDIKIEKKIEIFHYLFK